MKLESKMMLWSDRRIAPGEEESFQPYMTPYLLPGDQRRLSAPFFHVRILPFRFRR